MKQKIRISLENIIFPLILLLYPLRHVAAGIDLRDTGYNYANFLYMGTDHMDPMWLFSTYLSNCVGHFFSLLPGGDTLLGMNIYTGLIVSLLALLSYVFLVKTCRMSSGTVFLGEFAAISLCWCPTAVLYNYLTYLFLTLCVIFLYLGLQRDQGRYLIAAGFVLGMNVFVRFSNLPEMVLIVGVWAYAVICRKKFGKVLGETGMCLAGYVGAFLVFLGYIAVRYGFTSYVEGIQRLFAITDTASDYKASSMVLGAVSWYVENLYWVVRIGAFCIPAYVLWIVLPDKIRKGKQALCIIAAAACLYFLHSRGFAPASFTEYISMLRPSVLFLMLSMAVCAVDVFAPKTEKKFKLLGGFILLVLLITPIGSNNKLYPAINNLFLAAPYVACRLYSFAKFGLNKKFELFGKIKLSFSLVPLKVFIGMFLLLFFLQSTGFGVRFVFQESHGITGSTDSRVNGSEALAGIRMERERADWMQEIGDYVADNSLSGREVILYGDIPSMSFYLGMPSAFNPWPDLASYGKDVMEEALQETIGQDVLPVVLLEKRYVLYLKGGEEALREAGFADSDIAYVASDEKFRLLTEYMNEASYEGCFENEKFGLYDTSCIQLSYNLIK